MPDGAGLTNPVKDTAMLLLDSRKPLPVANMKSTVEDLRRLADDIERLASGVFPAQDELEAAPFLARFQPNLTLAPVLCGDVTGHPLLPGTNRTITTSPLYVLDLENGWARTQSRLYRLGRQIGEPNERVN
jgi:hypothetical protein